MHVENLWYHLKCQQLQVRERNDQRNASSWLIITHELDVLKELYLSSLKCASILGFISFCLFTSKWKRKRERTNIFLLFFYHRKIIDEVSKIAQLKCKYIISIYGMCSEASAVVMEYMSNGSLYSLLASYSFMWSKKFQMIHEIAMGMNFLHSMKPPLLHLNLKTSNILLDDHLHVKVNTTLPTFSDFRLIKVPQKTVS